MYALADFRHDCGWVSDFTVDELPVLHEIAAKEAAGTGYEQRFAQPAKQSALWPHFFPAEGQTLALSFFAGDLRRDVALVNFLARTLSMNPFLASLPKVYCSSGVSVFMRQDAGNPLHKKEMVISGFLDVKCSPLPTVVTREFGSLIHVWHCHLRPRDPTDLVERTGASCGCLFDCVPAAGQQLEPYEKVDLLMSTILGGSRDVLAILLADYASEFDISALADLYSSAASVDDLVSLKMIRGRIPGGMTEAEVALYRTSEYDLDQTALNCSLTHGSHTVAEYLLDVVVAAHADFFDDYADSCLEASIVANNVRGFRSFLSRAPHLRIQGDNQMVTHIALALRVKGGDPSVGDAMLDAMSTLIVNVDTFAVARDMWNVEAFSHLVERFGFDPSATDSDGAYLLHHYTSKYRDEGLCKLLLTKFDISPNVLDGSGQTPLHWAAKAGNLIVAITLVEYGAHVSVQDNYGRRPIDYAALGSQLECFLQVRVVASPKMT